MRTTSKSKLFTALKLASIAFCLSAIMADISWTEIIRCGTGDGAGAIPIPIAVGEPHPDMPGGFPDDDVIIGMPNPFSLPCGIEVSDFQIVAGDQPGMFHFELDTTFNAAAYELENAELIQEGTMIIALVDFGPPLQTFAPVTDPFWTRIGTLTLEDGEHQLLPIVNRYRGYQTVIPFHVKDGAATVEKPVPTVEYQPSVDKPPVIDPDDPVAVGDPIPAEPTLFPERIEADGIIIYNPAIHVIEDLGGEGNSATIVFSGEFATAGYEIIRHDMIMTRSIPPQIVFHVEIAKPEGAVAEVLTPFRVEIGTFGLYQGMTPIRGTINGEAAIEYVHHWLPAQSEPKPVTVDDIIIYNPAIEIVPGLPKQGEEFSIIFRGEFATAGYEIVGKNLAILESLPEQLAFHLEIAKPEGAVATVITPFEIEVGRVSLSAGEHPIWGTINGKRAIESRFYVTGSDDRKPENPNEQTIQLDAGLSGFQARAPFVGGYELGDVQFGELARHEGSEAFSNGEGIRVVLEPGEGATFIGAPIVTGDDYIYLRISCLGDDENVAVGLGALDANPIDSTDTYGMNGSSGVTLLNDASRIKGRFGFVEAVYKSERGAAVPVFQAVNLSDTKTVTVEFDNLIIKKLAAIAE